MLNHLFKELLKSLEFACGSNPHPFRTFAFTSIDKQGIPDSRTVVLRNVSPSLQLVFFTDSRGQKMQQVEANPLTCLLFYDPQNGKQLKISADAFIIKDKKRLRGYWESLPEVNKKNYASLKAPGTHINSPKETQFGEEYHFAAIAAQAKRIEYLQLEPHMHTRVLYKLIKGTWQGQYLVP